MNKKQFKYRAGVGVMAACWLVSGYVLACKPKQHAPLLQPALNKAIDAPALPALPAPDEPEPLPLPTWENVIGLDLMLFEPIPPNHVIKQIEKKQGRRKKKK